MRVQLCEHVGVRIGKPVTGDATFLLAARDEQRMPQVAQLPHQRTACTIIRADAQLCMLR
jgi:hypothetical protein